MTGYAKEFDDNVTMSFIVRDKQLLKNYIKIWDKIEKLMKINFESNPVYGNDVKYIKTKIKIYAGSVIRYLYKIPFYKIPFLSIKLELAINFFALHLFIS